MSTQHDVLKEYPYMAYMFAYKSTHYNNNNINNNNNNNNKDFY